MIYNYPSHYLYDFLAVCMLLVLAKQLYNLVLSKKQIVAFVLWMMTWYQINFYIVIPLLPREFKYITLYIGLILGFVFIIRLKLVGSLIVIMTTSALNGVFTNINLFFMLRTLFPNYGVALEAQHVQYTCYIVSIIILSLMTKALNIRILDIQKYN
ncbi:MAG: hypothetical protein JEZ08_15460 [Clostridiales bacterium]|nr:hypothetical protein [Clostridiales bacterium]